jgi:hypothetical protein
VPPGGTSPDPRRLRASSSKASNLAGKADTGDVVWVFNADNAGRFGDFEESAYSVTF